MLKRPAFFQRFNELPIVPKVTPSPAVTRDSGPISATPISARIRPYSIAVAPRQSRRSLGLMRTPYPPKRLAIRPAVMVKS